MKMSRMEPPAGRRSPTGAQTAPGDAAACPRGANINDASIPPVRDSRATRRVTTSSELLWKAHILFRRKLTSPKMCPIFLVLLQLAKRLCPSNARGYDRFEKLLYQNPSRCGITGE